MTVAIIARNWKDEDGFFHFDMFVKPQGTQHGSKFKDEWKARYEMEKVADACLLCFQDYGCLLEAGNLDSKFVLWRDNGWMGRFASQNTDEQPLYANFLWDLLILAKGKIPKWETVEFATMRSIPATCKNVYYVITYETNNNTRPKQITEVSEPFFLLEGSARLQEKLNAMPPGVRNVKCRQLQGC